MYAYFDKSFFDIHAKAPAEVVQIFHYYSPHVNTLRRSTLEVFPFQFCTTPSEPHKRPRGEKPLNLFSPYH